MKTGVKILFILVLFCIQQANAQEIKLRSSVYSFNITKEPPKPPILVISNLQFVDVNNNNCIDANENCKILFTLTNEGFGEGNGLNVSLKQTSNISGLNFSNSQPISNIAVSKTQTIEIPLRAQQNLSEGKVSFVVKVDEPNGFGSDEYFIEISTRAFVSPWVMVTDNTVTSNTATLVKKRPFDLQILVQNTKAGLAENVNVKLQLPQHIMCLSGNETTTFQTLSAGETQTIVYSLIVPEQYTASNIPITISISEKYGKYAENKTINLALNQTLSPEKIVVVNNGISTNDNPIEIATLGADVDKNIPLNSSKYPNRYALIIGNEDYTTYQPQLSAAANVDFAVNDAQIFAMYAERVMGIPKENIKILTNAIGSQMKQEIEVFISKAKYTNGQAELFFYYAGHGFPDENKDAYIMPVDINGEKVTDGIMLAWLYQQLTIYPAKRVTVFLDACFSGGGRAEGLVAARGGIRVKPVTNTLTGNIVVFSACSGEQESLPFREKNHGYFTYFLLKKLQETAGQVTYKEISDYLKNIVPLTSIDKSRKEQNPETQISTAVENIWQNWNFK